MRSLPHFDYRLLALIGVVLVFGFIMLTSASSVLAFERYDDSYYLLKRQLLSGAIGILALWLFSRFDYRRLKNIAHVSLLITIILLVAVLIPGVGVKLLGAQRWISLGPIAFQPSELAKLTLLLYLATWLDQRRLGGREGGIHLRTFAIVVGLTAGLIILQPDLGTMMVVSLIAFAVYFASGATLKQILTLVGVGVSAVLLLVLIEPYRFQRLTTFLNPSIDAQGQGYHINQSLIAIGSGGLFGVGLGHSRQKFNYLPEASGDSIFAVTAEELGFFAVVILLGIFVAIIRRGLAIARAAPDTFGRTLALGITCWFGIQAFLNIAALSGLLPLTGIPLPLVSYGGTSMIVLLSAFGILLNISRSARGRST